MTMKLIVFYSVAAQISKESGLPLEKVYDLLKETGFSGIEPLVWGETGNDMKAFRQKAEASGLSVPSCAGVFPFYRDGDMDKGKKFIEAAAELGAQNALILPSPPPENASRYEAREMMAGMITRLCDFGERCGIQLSMENFSHLQCPFSLTDDFEFLLREIPKLRMNFDTGNFIWVNESPSEAIDRFIAVRNQPFSHVHMKNYSYDRYNDNGNAAGYSLDGKVFYSYPTVGGGLTDLGYICRKLKEIGYDGYVSIENEGIVPAEPALSDSYLWLRDALEI